MDYSYKNIFKNYLETGKLFFLFGLFLLPSAISLSIIFLLISLAISFWNDSQKLFCDRINLVFLAACFLLIISGFSNFFDNNSINNLLNNSSITFIGLLNWIPLVFAYIGFQKYLLNSIDRRRCFTVLILGSIPVIFSCFGQVIFKWYGPMQTFFGLIVWYQRPLDGITGITGLFNNPNYLVAWLNIIWPFCLTSIFFDNNNKIKLTFKILLIFAISLIVILAASRAGWVSLLIPILVIYGKNIKLKALTIFSGFSLTTLYFSAYLFGLQIKDLLLKIIPKGIWINFTELEYKNLDISRLGIWKNALNFISENPFFGHGSKSFTSLLLNDSGIWKGHTHNLPLELMVDYGIPAAMLIILPITYLAIKASIKLFFLKLNINENTTFDRAWIISLISLIILHLVDIQYFDGRISIAGWILLAGTRNILLDDEDVSKT